MQTISLDTSEPGISDNILVAAAEQYQFWMEHPAMINDLGVAIDEIAVLFDSDVMAHECIRDLTHSSHGWEHFNSAYDAVTTTPIPSEYAVQYQFLSHPDAPYRLEIMNLGGGISPLHSAIKRHDRAIIVHASFKLAYRNEMVMWEKELRREGLTLAQRCVSSYGEFAYYADLHLEEPSSFLKPRINTRDGI